MRPRPERLLDYHEFPVLFVDDEPENLRVFELAFRREFRVATAHSGEEALRLLHELPTAVVLSDQRMEGLTGVELLARVREIDPRTVRILVTAYGDVETLRDAINNGAIYRYIAKPWQPEDMRITLRNAIEMYALDREREELLRELGILNRVASALNSRLESAPLLRLLVETATRELGYDGATVLRLDAERDRLEVAEAAPAEGEVASRLLELAITRRQAAGFFDALERGQIQRWASEDLLELDGALRQLATEIAAEEILVLPMTGCSELLGALLVDNRSGGKRFSAADRTLLSGLAAQAAVSLENARLVEGLRREQHTSLRSERMAAVGLIASEMARDAQRALSQAEKGDAALNGTGARAPGLAARRAGSGALAHARAAMDACVRLAAQATSDEVAQACEPAELVEEAVRLVFGPGVVAELPAVTQDGSLPKIQVERARSLELVALLLCTARSLADKSAQLDLSLRGADPPAPEGVLLELAFETTRPEDLERLLDPFAGQEAASPPALGLRLAERLAAEQNGSFAVESRPEGQVRFRVRLPAASDLGFVRR